jgi:hypothetical protein
MIPFSNLSWTQVFFNVTNWYSTKVDSRAIYKPYYKHGSLAESSVKYQKITRSILHVFFFLFLLGKSFRQIFGDEALGALNIKKVEVARNVGAAAKFTGSGGAVVAFCPGKVELGPELMDSWRPIWLREIERPRSRV